MLFGWLRRVAGGFLVGVAWMLVCYVWLRWVFVAVWVDCVVVLVYGYFGLAATILLWCCF